MNKIKNVIASFIIMLCLGGVYAWSIFVPELMNRFNYSSSQTQLVFGLLIAVFPTSMILAGKLEKVIGPRIIAIISGILFGLGYLLASISNGNYILVLLGIGIIAGIGTGFGYMIALSTPVKWFPEKKGLITGIAAAGFGLASVILSYIAELLMNTGKPVLDIFGIIGISYGLVIILFSFLIKNPHIETQGIKARIKDFITKPIFIKLFAGILAGTFAGLLVIGNLKPIGATSITDDNILVLGISIFAIANFLGRLTWGYLSDHIGAALSILISLTLQGLAIFLIGFLSLSPSTYLMLAALIGFNFGANFVLFAKETAQLYGINNLGIVYPFVFLGYALAGILGPLTGGMIYDLFQDFKIATTIAAFVSLAGALIYLPESIKSKKNHLHQ